MTRERPRVLFVIDKGESAVPLHQAYGETFDVHVSDCPEQTLETVASCQPSVVVLGFQESAANPLTLAQALTNPQHRIVNEAMSLVYLNHREISDWLDRILDAGVDICINAQASAPQLHVALRSAANICEARQELLDSQIKLQRAYDRVKKFSLTDDLTGLYNMRFMSRQLRNEFKRAQRYQKHLSLLLLNIDGFARIHSEFGEQIGSEFITRVGQELGDSVRFEIDYTARWSAEEFAILLPETDLVGGISVAERLRRTIEDLVWEGASKKICATASVGIAHFHGERGNFLAAEELIIAAQQGVRIAQAHGGNQYCALDDVGEVDEGQSA